MSGWGFPLSRIAAHDFDLALTLDSGQVFHWVKADAGFSGVIGDVPVYVEQRGESLAVSKGAGRVVRRYFALDHPLSEIYETFPKDEPVTTALGFCRGLRIIRQPAWECLATFITSSMKQVAHIQQMSHAIRRNFGERVVLGGAELFAYPSAARLAEAGEPELRACKLGYRAKNLLAAARMIAAGEVDLARIEKLDDERAVEELCRLPGVGEKVANCVLLFAYGRLAAFPIDVWIERVLRELYFKRKRKVTAKQLKLFSQKYFGRFGGYAQQYLFHHARKTRRKGE
jgi:N-glycosylase/DNA lyase